MTRRVQDTHELFITYWDCICSALLTLGVDTHTTLIQGFWPQSQLIVVESDTMLFSNGDVREEFALDEIILAQCAIVQLRCFVWSLIAMKVIWFLYVLEMRSTPSQFSWWKSCLHPIFIQTSFNFHQIKVEYCRPNTKDQNVFCTYLVWDTKKNFKWTVDSTYGPVWINTDTILCSWKLRKGSKSKTMTIPPKYIEFAKDNLARIATMENDVENGYEAEDGDGEI